MSSNAKKMQPVHSPILSTSTSSAGTEISIQTSYNYASTIKETPKLPPVMVNFIKRKLKGLKFVTKAYYKYADGVNVLFVRTVLKDASPDNCMAIHEVSFDFSNSFAGDLIIDFTNIDEKDYSKGMIPGSFEKLI